MASSLNSLETYYGRPDIKVLEITQDKDSSYKRLFYRSTGSGNEKFKNIFSDTLVPFYHHIEDETDKPIVKAVMKRNEIKKTSLFKWQSDLLEFLHSKNVTLNLLKNTFDILYYYFNTPGELYVSIKDNKGFWENNQLITNEIEEFLKPFNINYKYHNNKDIREIVDNIEDYLILHVKEDPKNLPQNFKDSNKFILRLEMNILTDTKIKTFNKTKVDKSKKVKSKIDKTKTNIKNKLNESKAKRILKKKEETKKKRGALLKTKRKK